MVHRDRPTIQLTLSPEAIAALEELAIAAGRTRSAQAEEMIREAALAAKLDIRDLGARERKSRGLSRTPATRFKR